MRLTLLHNPASGDEEHGRERLETLLHAAGHEVVYRSLGDADWREVLRESGDVIVVAGGDGTVRQVFTALDESPTTATIFPTGSANNIAETLGFDTDDPAELVARLETASRRRFDLWDVEGSWGPSRIVEAAGAGVLAEAFASAEDEPSGDEKVEHGLEVVRQTLRGAAPQQWLIEADGHRFELELLGVEAMNVGRLGPQLTLAPGADPGDGRLEVVLLRGGDRDPLLGYLDARLAGHDAELPRLESLRCEELRLELPAGSRAHVDDALPPEELDEPRELRIRRADVELEVLVPAAAPGDESSRARAS